MSSILTVATAASMFGAPISDADLGDMRGGFALPGGLNVAIAVQTDTNVNGALVLRTVYRVDQVASLAVYAPNAGDAVQTASGEPAAANIMLKGGVSVTFDRVVGPRVASNMSSMPGLSVSASGSAVGSAPPDTMALNLQRDGPAVSAGVGSVKLSSLPGGQQVRYLGDAVDINHLIGDTIGSIVSNSASDRSIDTATTLSLDISGATASNIGSALFRVDTLALDSTAMMVTR